LGRDYGASARAAPVVHRPVAGRLARTGQTSPSRPNPRRVSTNTNRSVLLFFHERDWYTAGTVDLGNWKTARGFAGGKAIMGPVTTSLRKR
jgi:hypothetical protein